MNVSIKKVADSPKMDEAAAFFGAKKSVKHVCRLNEERGMLSRRREPDVSTKRKAEDTEEPTPARCVD